MKQLTNNNTIIKKIQIYKLFCPPYNWVVACKFCKVILINNYLGEDLVEKEVQKLYQQPIHYPQPHA